MDQRQNTELPRRPSWAIDGRLEGMLGRDVRVAVDAFSPRLWNGEGLPTLSSVRDLILPDNSPAGCLPVLFEGRLRQFERRVAVVYASLEAPTFPQDSAEGIVSFRGRAAVIVRGPATVRLAFPFRVEPIPADADNYWEDLRLPCAQFRLPFP